MSHRSPSALADTIPQELLSPGLIRGTTLPAFEIKFLLPDGTAQAVEQRLRRHLAPDPHGDPSPGGGYEVTTVYFDTPRWDVYARSEGFGQQKYRIRRYGSSSWAFLEQKSRTNQRVQKRRSPVPLAPLATPPPDSTAYLTDEPSRWFFAAVAQRHLRPVVRITYRRTALIGSGADGPMRATFDRQARGVATDSFFPECVEGGRSLLHHEVILELKFLTTMPQAFKGILEEFRLTPQTVSKYRRCIDALGLGPGTSTNYD